MAFPGPPAVPDQPTGLLSPAPADGPTNLAGAPTVTRRDRAPWQSQEPWGQSIFTRTSGFLLAPAKEPPQRRYSLDLPYSYQGDTSKLFGSPFGPVGGPVPNTQLQQPQNPPSSAMYSVGTDTYGYRNAAPAPPGYGTSFQNYTQYTQQDRAYYNTPLGSSTYEPLQYDSPDTYMDYDTQSSPKPRGQNKASHSRRSSSKDELDGDVQYLSKPSQARVANQARPLPQIPISLRNDEQDLILSQVNDCLSQCAFDFVAKYQFPIPVEADKRKVETAADREWTEWVYLLKKLATKRRIPSRVLYQGQIKQFVTILENSMEMRHAAKHQSRPPKDDRNVLQLISAGIQVAKLLQDAEHMQQLNQLYISTEQVIQGRPQIARYSM